MNEKKEKRSFKGFIVVLLLMLCVLGGVLGYAYNVIDKRDAHNQLLSESIEESQEETVEETVSEEYSGYYYRRLSAGEDVNIWIFGDESTYMNANEAASWKYRLSEKLSEEYGSNVNIQSFSNPYGGDAFTHYALLQEQLNSGESAEIILLSMGYYEDLFVFPIYYEAILRSISLRMPEARIISLIEGEAIANTEGHSDELASQIRNLTDAYRGLTVSLSEAIAFTAEERSTFYLNDSPFWLTEEGEELYAQWIFDAIQEDRATEHSGEESGEVELVSTAVSAFDRYSYVPASDFVRISDLDYQLTAEHLRVLSAETAGTIAVDFDLVQGRNDVNVSIDGALFGGYGIDFDVETSQTAWRHIEIVNNNANITDYLSVSFASKEGADAFRGLIISGNLSFIKAEEDYTTLPIPEKQITEPVAESEAVPEEVAEGEGDASEEGAEGEVGESAEGESEEDTEASSEDSEGETTEVESEDTTSPEETEVASDSVEEATSEESEVVSSESEASEDEAAAPETEESEETISTDGPLGSEDDSAAEAVNEGEDDAV